jgi:hypothetical protein
MLQLIAAIFMRWLPAWITLHPFAPLIMAISNLKTGTHFSRPTKKHYLSVYVPTFTPQKSVSKNAPGKNDTLMSKKGGVQTWRTAELCQVHVHRKHACAFVRETWKRTWCHGCAQTIKTNLSCQKLYKHGSTFL